MPLTLQPISFREACAFIRKLHRHHKPPQGWLFGVAVNDGEKVVGVATVGRPVARMLQDGFTAEVTRCCTDGTPHVASKLYGAAWRAARALGYRSLDHLHVGSRSRNKYPSLRGGAKLEKPEAVNGAGRRASELRLSKQGRRRCGKEPRDRAGRGELSR